MEAMTGMRNKLVHHYFGVDWEMWKMLFKLSFQFPDPMFSKFSPDQITIIK